MSGFFRFSLLNGIQDDLNFRMIESERVGAPAIRKRFVWIINIVLGDHPTNLTLHYHAFPHSQCGRRGIYTRFWLGASQRKSDENEKREYSHGPNILNILNDYSTDKSGGISPTPCHSSKRNSRRSEIKY